MNSHLWREVSQQRMLEIHSQCLHELDIVNNLQLRKEDFWMINKAAKETKNRLTLFMFVNEKFDEHLNTRGGGKYMY